MSGLSFIEHKRFVSRQFYISNFQIHVTNEDISDRSWEEFIDLIHPQIFRNITAMKFRAPTKVQVCSFHPTRQFHFNV